MGWGEGVFFPCGRNGKGRSTFSLDKDFLGGADSDFSSFFC